jgi:LacI family transcriptional regulator
MTTLNDIAKKAGVSRTTVSYVLNKGNSPRGIGDETRQRVIQIAQEMGYQTNALAKAIVTGQSRILAFLDFNRSGDTEFRSRILAGMLAEAEQQGYQVKVNALGEGVGALSDALQQCVAWRTAGIVAIGLGHHRHMQLIESAQRSHIPLVTIEELEGDIKTNHAQGVRLALEHLYQLDHRRIAYLASGVEDKGSTFRIEMFRKIHEEWGISLGDDWMAHGDWWEIAPNEKALYSLLDRPNRPTALVTCGDPGAMVAIRIAHTLGLRIPQDLSLIGYGDYTMATYATPPLTTIRQPFSEMGSRAVRRLVENLSNPDALTPKPEREELEATLIVRESTGRAPSDLS